ncbi:MAG: hypothetical protein B6U76_00745 [Desulfurococcales archaeon ex4484_217_2]|nr:MAG: hypothetical protein B6U76_00745 [Desulfurococcales archaeon ex4484_217_2]
MSILKRTQELGLKVVKGFRVKKTRKLGKRWIVNDEFEAKKLKSTIPLNEVIDAIEVPSEVIKLARWLDYNALIVVDIALNKKALGIHWIYVPDHSIVFP